MRRPLSKRKCKHCQTFFDPHPRSAGRQHYCPSPRATKPAKPPANVGGYNKPANRDYFTGPTHVERVGSGAKPTRATGDARALGPPMRYKMP